MTDWDDRFVSGEYPRAPEPSAVLRSYEPAIPDGRALDVAAGTGRNAVVYLAEAGYAVDALDASREGLAIVRERAPPSAMSLIGSKRFRPTPRRTASRMRRTS